MSWKAEFGLVTLNERKPITPSFLSDENESIGKLLLQALLESIMPAALFALAFTFLTIAFKLGVGL